MALRFGLISSCNEVEIRYVRSPGYVDWLLYLSAEVHTDQCPTFPSLSQAWLLGTIATYTGNTCERITIWPFFTTKWKQKTLNTTKNQKLTSTHVLVEISLKLQRSVTRLLLSLICDKSFCDRLSIFFRCRSENLWFWCVEFVVSFRSKKSRGQQS